MADEIEEVEESGNSEDSVETAEPKDETDYKVAYEKTMEALRKEREISKAAEKKAKEAERSVAKTVEDRVSAIETENRQLKLERLTDKEIKSQLSSLKKDGFTVDEDDLRDMLSDVNLTEDNMTEKIAKFAGRLKKPVKTITPDISQSRDDAKAKIDPKSPPSLTDVFK